MHTAPRDDQRSTDPTPDDGRLGLEGQFFALPTAFFASLGKGGQHWTFIQRSPSGDVNLEKLCDLQETTDALIAGDLDQVRVALIAHTIDSAEELVTMLAAFDER